MNRKTLVAFCVVVLPVALWFYFGQIESNNEYSGQAPQVAEPERLSGAESDKEEPTASEAGQNDFGIDAETHAFLQKSMADPMYEWKQPIEFYGKVVTLDGQPIEDVTVEYGWTVVNGYETRTIRSDGNGLFELTGVQGKTMTVKLEKEGYDWFVTRTQKHFEFAEPYAPNFHKADPAKPLVYYMQERPEAEPLHVNRGKKHELFITGKGVFYDYVAGVFSSAARGKNSIRLTPKIDSFDPTANSNYTWSVTLEGEGLQFLVSDMVVTSIAPENTYMKELEIGRSAEDESDWSSQRTETIFFKTTDGNYARVRLVATARPESEKINIRLDSYFNPSGSRVLVFSSQGKFYSLVTKIRIEVNFIAW